MEQFLSLIPMRPIPTLAFCLAISTLGLLADNPATVPSPAGTNAAPASAPPTATTNAAATPAPALTSGPSLYNFTVTSIDGKPVDLGQYRGKVALVVNTASHCGYRSQLGELEKLYQDYKDKGFIVLAFPSNDFGGQEPDSDKDIATFCTTTYHTTYPLFDKVKTRGDGQSPVYQFLSQGHSKPQWNFHKYLVDKSGKVIGEFHSQVSPDNKDLRAAIDAALKS